MALTSWTRWGVGTMSTTPHFSHGSRQPGGRDKYQVSRLEPKGASGPKSESVSSNAYAITHRVAVYAEKHPGRVTNSLKSQQFSFGPRFAKRPARP